MIRFDDLTILVLTVDNGSLSAVARVLNIAPTAASAIIKRSEAELGVWLLAHSTCSPALTQEGERHLQHARRALADLQARQGVFILGRQTIGGDISLSIPSGLGRSVLTDWLDDFLIEHPAVALQVCIGDRLVDMFRQRVDAAVRCGESEDSSLVASPLAPDNRRMLCTAPAYFARYDVPKTPNDLHRHSCLLLALSDTAHDQWIFHGAGGDGQVHVTRIIGSRIADDDGLVRRQVVAGHGIAYRSRLDALAGLRAGRLQVALTNQRGEAIPLHLICMHRLVLSPTLMWLRDFLQKRIADHLADA